VLNDLENKSPFSIDRTFNCTLSVETCSKGSIFAHFENDMPDPSLGKQGFSLHIDSDATAQHVNLLLVEMQRSARSSGTIDSRNRDYRLKDHQKAGLKRVA